MSNTQRLVLLGGNGEEEDVDIVTVEPEQKRRVDRAAALALLDPPLRRLPEQKTISAAERAKLRTSRHVRKRYGESNFGLYTITNTELNALWKMYYDFLHKRVTELGEDGERWERRWPRDYFLKKEAPKYRAEMLRLARDVFA